MGGVENYTYNLAKYLIKRGDRVVIVTSRTGDLPETEISEDILIVRMPCLSLMNGRYPVLLPKKDFFRLHKKLKKYKFDLVLVNTRFYLHSVYGAAFAKAGKIRCGIIEHGTTHMTVHNKVGDFLEQMVEHILTFIDKRLCREFYGVSNACGDWLKHFGIESSGTLYNAVDLEKIQTIQKQEGRDFRKEYQIPENGIVVGFTGRLLKEKGLYQLIDSVNQLRKEGYAPYLLIAGEGDEQERIGELADDHIIPVGRLCFEDVVAMLMQTDIFCLPSDSEGFPTSVLEAVACGCFVITTETGGAKEMITGREYGIILPDNRVERITEALREVLNAPEDRKKVAEAAYERLKESYTWETTAKQVDDLAQGKKIRDSKERNNKDRS